MMMQTNMAALLGHSMCTRVLTNCKAQQCILSLTAVDRRAAPWPTAAVTAASAAASSALHSSPKRPTAAAVGIGWLLPAEGKPLGVKLMMSVCLFCRYVHGQQSKQRQDMRLMEHPWPCCLYVCRCC
jgi:hypothetical protein